MVRVALLLFIAGALVGCARGSSLGARASWVEHGEELRIALDPSAHGRRFSISSAHASFRRATRMARRGECPGAVRLFDRIARRHPSSRYAPAALYDAGLCLARLERLPEASRRFERLLRRAPDSVDGDMARLWLLELDARLERWAGAMARATAMLRDSNLAAPLRVRVLAHRARALLALERPDEAASSALSALRLSGSRPRGERESTWALGLATYVLAEIHRLEAQTLAPGEAEPPRDVQAMLERRARLLLEAQRLYIDTLRRGHPRWSAAAESRIATLYVDVLQGLPDALTEPSGDISEEERAAPSSSEEVSARVWDLVDRAISQAELAVTQGRAVPEGEDWTQRLATGLEQARSRLERRLPRVSDGASDGGS